MKTKLALLALLAGLWTLDSGLWTCNAQTNPAPAPDLSQGLIDAFDVHNTNSLINAREINVTPLFKWNARAEEPGGGLKVDWWLSDQQGAFIGFDEFRDRSSYLNLGYQARTVFKSLELSLGAGTQQNNDEPFGQVDLFISPALTKQIISSAKWDVRVTFGADITTQGKPSPFLGLTLRALKF